MAIKIVTGVTGTAHVTSADDRGLNAGMMGADSYVLGIGNKFDFVIVSNNKIRIKDGEMLIQGCHARLEANTTQDCNIDTGTSGKKRTDLIVARYAFDSVSGHESVSLVVIKGTPGNNYVTPSYNTGEIRTGSTVVDFPLYKVNINGLSIESVETLFMVAVPATIFICTEAVHAVKATQYPNAFFAIIPE